MLQWSAVIIFSHELNSKQMKLKIFLSFMKIHGWWWAIEQIFQPSLSRLNPTLVWTLSSDIQNFLSSSLFSVYKEWFWVSICSPPAIIDIWRFHFSITSTQLIIWFVANYRNREEREDAITICFRVDHTVFYALRLLILSCALPWLYVNK